MGCFTEGSSLAHDQQSPTVIVFLHTNNNRRRSVGYCCALCTWTSLTSREPHRCHRTVTHDYQFIKDNHYTIIIITTTIRLYIPLKYEECIKLTTNNYWLPAVTVYNSHCTKWSLCKFIHFSVMSFCTLSNLHKS